MKIAYTMAPGQGDTDLLLLGIAETLSGNGYNAGGTVQINTEREGGPCDMDVKVLPAGPNLRISQDLGQGSTGCRLDPEALETAVGLVAARIRPELDLLIINKFGKHEADGRGFRSVIAEAIGLDIPVLVGLNALNLDAFLEFAGSEAEALDPNPQAILCWFDPCLGATRFPKNQRSSTSNVA
jgi:nucleoside-triphosphatase THEP1